jgi:L-ascorbate metabolism protein UlaG (beta-lactamase superfamily)
MKLTRLHQSGFILQLKSGKRIAWDIGNKTPIAELKKVVDVDAFIVSHIHGDHFSPEHINALHPKKLISTSECVEAIAEKKPQFDLVAVAGGQVQECDGIRVIFFNVDHGPNISAPVENLGFLLTVSEENESIYFAGDMFSQSGMDVERLQVSHALIPVGGFYTFGPQEAHAFINKFELISNVIPTHYENDPKTRAEFLALQGANPLKTREQKSSPFAFARNSILHGNHRGAFAPV